MIPIVVGDWETYYDGEYSLSKMGTEAYLRDPRFEEIGLSLIMPGEEKATWYTDGDIPRVLKSIDWSRTAFLAHNNYFDGAILAWHHGIWPKLYLCSMCIAQPRFGFTSGVSLASLMRVLEVGEKGDEVIRALGKRRSDFSDWELYKYGEYCCNDALGSKRIFQELLPTTATKEIVAIDETIRCFTDPRLVLDKPMLVEYHQHVKDVKETHYLWASNLLGIDDDAQGTAVEKVRDVIMSNDKLANLLMELGVDPPTKLSPTTGKVAYAFAKTDDEFLALKEHEDERVQTLITCRLGGKSTIAETRALRFIEMADRGSMPAYFKYYAAHPGRLGGGDGTNLQNLTRKSELRDAIMAPPGHVLVAGDESQIEARLLVTVAGQQDILQAFKDYDAGIGPDIYCVTASAYLGKQITKEANPQERQLGKVIRLALGYGMGVPKFIITARRDGVKLTPAQADTVHKWYRATNEYVVRLWQAGNTALKKLEAGEEWSFGINGCIVVRADGIHLPSGRVLRYPGLQYEKEYDKTGHSWSGQWTYLNRKKRVRIYGAKAVENIMQSLAGSVCLDAWIELRHKMKIVLQIHDELVAVVPTAQAEVACEQMRVAMSRTPAWLPELPVACEVGYAQRFGHIRKS